MLVIKLVLKASQKLSIFKLLIGYLFFNHSVRFSESKRSKHTIFIFEILLVVVDDPFQPILNVHNFLVLFNFLLCLDQINGVGLRVFDKLKVTVLFKFK